MTTVKIEQHDAGTYAILMDGEQIGHLEYQAPTVWRAKMTRYNAYTGREFTGPTHARAFFDEQFGDKPVTYRWTIVWTDGTSQTGRAKGALAAYKEVAAAVTHATSPQRAEPKKILVYTVARADGELSSTVHIGPPGQHELNADAAQFDRNRQDPRSTAAPAEDPGVGIVGLESGSARHQAVPRQPGRQRIHARRGVVRRRQVRFRNHQRGAGRLTLPNASWKTHDHASPQQQKRDNGHRSRKEPMAQTNKPPMPRCRGKNSRGKHRNRHLWLNSTPVASVRNNRADGEPETRQIRCKHCGLIQVIESKTWKVLRYERPAGTPSATPDAPDTADNGRNNEENAAAAATTLQVIVAADGDGWVAQGIEIDYAAGGDSPADAMDRFAVGLEATAQASLNNHGNLTAFLQPTKIEDWLPLIIAGAAKNGEFRTKPEQVNLKKVGLQMSTITYVLLGPAAESGAA